MKQTVISKGVKLEGSIRCETDLVLFGDAQGMIEAKENVCIDVGGHFRGEVIAKGLVVKGVFEGVADCDTVEILKGGRFIGDIRSRLLMIESKGYFEGKSDMKEMAGLSPNGEKKRLKEPETDDILL